MVKMGMKTLFPILVIFILISTSNTTIISRDSPHIRETDTPPCATDSSGAFIDLIVLIDTSTNMGSTNVRKIANILNLALASFPIGNQWDITLGQKNTRVSVITYDQQATIIANYTQINQLNDLTNVVNGIQVSTSQTANLYDNNYPFYIGLHQNSQNQWVWYDYNRNEFPVGNYTDWANGNPSSGGCAVMDSDDGTNFVWKSYGCNTEATGLNLVFCQKLACDTTSFACCADCNGGSTESCTVGWFERKNNRRLNKNKKI
uniref:C-type lectin domain-containing protein n=1 Tax=Acrobeloides nanus TaxID=290746 RepID=A0A914BUT7_9BILA